MTTCGVNVKPDTQNYGKENSTITLITEVEWGVGVRRKRRRRRRKQKEGHHYVQMPQID